jgi:hypothetical protein
MEHIRGIRKLILQIEKWSNNRSIQQILMFDRSERFKACDLPFDLDLD